MLTAARDPDSRMVELKVYPASFPVDPEGSVSIGGTAKPFTENLHSEVAKWSRVVNATDARVK